MNHIYDPFDVYMACHAHGEYFKLLIIHIVNLLYLISHKMDIISSISCYIVNLLYLISHKMDIINGISCYS